MHHESDPTYHTTKEDTDMPERTNKVYSEGGPPARIEPGTILTDRCTYYIVAEFARYPNDAIHYTAISLSNGHFYCFPVDSMEKLRYELRDLSVLAVMEEVVINHKHNPV